MEIVRRCPNHNTPREDQVMHNMFTCTVMDSAIDLLTTAGFTVIAPTGQSTRPPSIDRPWTWESLQETMARKGI